MMMMMIQLKGGPTGIVIFIIFWLSCCYFSTNLSCMLQSQFKLVMFGILY